MLQFVFNFTTHPLDWSLFDNSTCKNKKSNGCSSTLQNEQNLQTADISVNDHVRALQSESNRRLCNISLARFSTVWKCSQIAFMKWALIDETPTLRPDDYHWQHCSGNANSDSGEPRWVTPWDVTREETIHLKHLNNVGDGGWRTHIPSLPPEKQTTDAHQRQLGDASANRATALTSTHLKFTSASTVWAVCI